MRTQFSNHSISNRRPNHLKVVFINEEALNTRGHSKSDQIRHLTQDDLFLKKVKAIILENISETDFGHTQLCRSLCLSYMQVYRKLRELTGETPSGYIRKVRLHQAKKMLQTTDLNISEIAYDLGFSDPNYFSRVFRKEFGVPPRIARNQLIIR